MTNPHACPHETTVPVEIRDPLDAGTGPVVEVVAHLCTACGTELPANWGCTACSWVEIRNLCEAVPQLLLARPCQEHA